MAMLNPQRSGTKWWPFGIQTQEDCILKYEKISKCDGASKLIYRVCRGKFAKNDLNERVNDCILSNLGDAQNDWAAGSIFRSCISKFADVPQAPPLSSPQSKYVFDDIIDIVKIRPNRTRYKMFRRGLVLCRGLPLGGGAGRSHINLRP